MPTRFPILICTAAVIATTAGTLCAQPAVSPTPAQPGLSESPVTDETATQPAAEPLMRRVVDTFGLHRSFSARLRHNVELFGQSLVGKGTYHQLGDGLNRLLRVEMTVKASGQGAASQLAHVCDGRYLWMYEEIGGTPKLSRIDLRRVNRAIEEARHTPTTADRAEPPPSLSMGSGGMGRLLRDLSKQFEMYAVRAEGLGNDPVWVFDGRWRTDRLAELLPNEAERIRAGKSVDLDKLARHLPHEVRLTVSRDAALLPYRIEFVRLKRDDETDAVDRQVTVAMEIYEIKVNENLDPQLFVYKPGSVEITDRTEKFLIQRGLKKRESDEKD